jgi:hypothetical protein
MTLDRFMDDFGRDLRHVAARPRRRHARRLLVAVPAATGLAAVGVVALPRGDGVDAVAAARQALSPDNEIVHMTIEPKDTGGRLRVMIPKTEQWYSASLRRWRTKTEIIRGPRGAAARPFEQIYGDERVRVFDARRNVVTIFDGVKLPRNAQVGVAGGDPATELREQLDAGDLRDDGVVSHDGRQVRRLVRNRKERTGFQEQFVYYMDPKSFAPVGGRMSLTVKGRRTFSSEFVISHYERIPLTDSSRRLLHFDTTDQRPPRLAFVHRGGRRPREVLRIVGDDVQHGDTRVTRDGVREVGADPLRALSRQGRDDHLVEAQRVPHLAERLARDRVADDAVAVLDARFAPGRQCTVQAALALIARGAARAARGHHQRRVERAALTPVHQRLDQLRRGGGAIGEHDHVSGHRAAPSCEGWV